VREKAPEMTACEAMTEAAVARRTSGRRPHFGARPKRGFAAAAGFVRRSAPWPK